VKQETLSARTPIVQTTKDANGVKVLEETFVVIPGKENRRCAAIRAPRWRGAIDELDPNPPGLARRPLRIFT